ncbi:outer membrane beta-barrel protein [Vibrio vulnificus]|uniref:outer membrane beta-barrel protein n=1 Tax=Vibrio vulnificus TaxID=672 RepID=UPI001FAC1B37|nr:outer membrane beta-barrel protein [Vibrio vulnificus]MCJ0819686.1 outer membrane beta-barrel protein [Vibrio vulnificus]MCJ0824247.1 outer membrane beta-barrel protein [Vibrio vulnificus]
MRIALLALLIPLAPSFAFADIHPYAGVNLGIGGIEEMDIEYDNLNYSQESGKFSWGVNSGFLLDSNISDKFQYGAEISYTSYATNKNEIEGISFNYDGYNIALMGVARYQLFESWSVMSKLGLAHTAQEVGINNRVTVSESEILPKFGIDIAYNATENLDILFGIDHIFGDEIKTFKRDSNLDNQSLLKNSSDVASVSTMYLGLKYNF